MKLFFDQNISPRLVQRFVDVFPGSTHVSAASLDRADDSIIWRYAQAHDLTIVTKDADFNDLTVLYGSPPRVIWLRLGNCTTQQIEACLRENVEVIEAFSFDPTSSILELY